VIVAFGLAFLITAALWWLYFNVVAAIAERRLAEAVNRTVVARDAYTYLHVVIVAGILLTAVGDEIVIAHPTDELTDAELAAVVSGPALYLLANVLLRLRMVGTLAGRRLAGALACLAVAAVGTFAPALVVAGLLFAVLVAVIVGDQIAGARRRQEGRAEPLSRSKM
jgi:low temperature requirement protein LtrA